MTPQHDTRPLPGTDKATGNLQPAPPPAPPTLHISWSVRFRVGEDELLCRISLDDAAIIGRSDDDFTPDIDLAPYDALNEGVSRRHARLTASSDYLLLTDLDSTNGTAINGHRLRAGEPYRLDHGDEVTIGNIALTVEFTLVPVHAGIKKSQGGTGSQVSLDEEEAQAMAERPILIVEDDESVSQLLADLVETLNYRSHQVHSVAEALRFIAAELPRAVLLDLRMPDDNGIEVCQMLRRDMGTRHLPIFVISGASDEEEIQAVLNAGADVFLSKPVGMNELVEALNRFID